VAAGRVFEAQRLAQEAAEGQRLAEIDQVRTALLAAVSHDLRTPLAGIKAAVSSLRQDDIDWTVDDERGLLATIEESADQLTHLVDNLLDMSRVQAGALSVSLNAVALDEVIAHALVATPSREVMEHIPEDLPLVRTDPALLERIVGNLVDNARRYSPADEPVTLRADAPSPTVVRLQVIDHGPGVPTNGYGAMFAPFQRLGDQSPEGVGLGLAIARGFSDAIGASLTPSTTPGGGLTMTLTLPAKP
jgi:K+-sensing histidine kinase KdpD